MFQLFQKLKSRQVNCWLEQKSHKSYKKIAKFKFGTKYYQTTAQLHSSHTLVN